MLMLAIVRFAPIYLRKYIGMCLMISNTVKHVLNENMDWIRIMSKKLLFVLLLLIVACGEAPPNDVGVDDGAVRDVAEVDSSGGSDGAEPTLTPPPLPPTNGDEPETETDTAVALDSPAVEEETAVENAEASEAESSEAVNVQVPVIDEAIVETVTELESQIEEELQEASGNELAFGGFETIETKPINRVDGSQLWMSYSVGFRPFDPIQNHFVLLLKPEGEGWLELGRVELEFPDILFPESVQTLEENGRLWLQVESGVGAHGGCFDLLLWDGTTFSHSVSQCHSSPAGAGELGDLNGDGQLDVLLNNTNDYIFCYACGVRKPMYQVQTFNGSFWETVSLAPAPEGDDYVVALNDAAVDLANAGLWLDASQTLGQLNVDDPTIVWNQTIVGLHEEAHLEMISYSPYPLLQAIFYGDYETSMTMMRHFAVTDLFSIEGNPLIVGTPAEGWLDPLSEELLSATELALNHQPDLAAAHFIHGWATFLVDPENPSVLQDIQQAATLAPTDPLYVDSLLLLSGG